MKKKGILYAAISALIYGFTPILCKICFDNGSNSLTLTFMRNLISLIVAMIWMIVKHESFVIKDKQGISIFIAGTFGCFLSPLLLYSSYSYVSIGQATMLHFMYPFVTVFACVIFYKDKINRKKIISLIIALIGVMMFIDFNNTNYLYGVGLALVSGVCYSIYLIMIEKRRLDRMNGVKLTFYLSLASTVEIFVYNFYDKSLNLMLPLNIILLIILISILASFIAVILLQKGIAEVGSATVSFICLLEPLSSMVFGYICLNEKLNTNSIIGSFLLIFALVIFIKNSSVRKSSFN
jgi:drug/metabolite transporter (DMT)-like permease